MVEEGQPEYIEQALNTILRRRDLQTKIAGKDVFPLAGEYTAPVMAAALRKFIDAFARPMLGNQPPLPDPSAILADPKVKALNEVVPARPPGFCTGCPERPIFAAMKLVRKGTRPASCRGRHRLPPLFDPAAVQHRRDDDGLRARAGFGVGLQCRNRQARRSRSWATAASGTTASPRRVGNAVFNKQDGVILDRRQLLFRRDRRPGHPVLARHQRPARDQQFDRRRRARASAPDGSARSTAPTTSARCATRCAKR